MLSKLVILKQSAEKAKQFIRHYIYFTNERDKSLTSSPIIIADCFRLNLALSEAGISIRLNLAEMTGFIFGSSIF